MTSLLTDILGWVIVLIGATGCGLRFLKRYPFHGAVEALVFSASLGLGILGYAVFTLGSFGFLSQPAMTGLAGAFLIFGARPFFKKAGEALGDARLSAREISGQFRILLLLLAGAAVFLSFTGALAPPIGQDELNYHLAHPQAYVKEGRIFEIPYSTPSLWPYLFQMLFTLGMALSGPVLAKLFHFTAYALAGGAIYSFLVRFRNRPAAVWGASLFFLTPVAFIQASFAYVDNALALYVFLAFYAAYLFYSTGRSSWIFMSGIFLGLALSVKFLALFLVPVIFGMLLWHGWKSSYTKPLPKNLALFTGAALLAGGLWYLRAWILRGNPVFPFFPGIFGHGRLDAISTETHGLGWGPWELLTFPWNATMHPVKFGGEHAGIFYLALLPLLFFMRPLPREVRWSLAAALAYSLFWFYVDQNMRFLLPALALLCVPLGYAASRLWEEGKIYGFLLKSLLAGFLFIQAAYAAYHFKEEALVFFGARDRFSYLSTHERTYDAARSMNRFWKGGEKVLSTGEVRTFYFEAPVVIESDFEAFTQYGHASSPGEVIEKLKSLGFTHVLASSLELPETQQKYRVPAMLADPVMKNRYFKDEIVVHNQNIRYVLYRIL